MIFPLTFLPVLIIFSSLFGCWMLTANENMVPPMLNEFASLQIFGQILGFDPLTR
jgi:hypothetical protein